MNRLFLFATALVLCFVPAAAFGQGKKGKNNIVMLETTPDDYKALAKLAGVQGRILSMDPVGKKMTLRVEYDLPDQDALRAQALKKKNAKQQGNKNAQNQQRLLQEYYRILQNPNPLQRQQQMQKFMARLQRDQQRDILQQIQQMQKQQFAKGQPGANANVPMVTYGKVFELDLGDKIDTARKELGLEYDDKGFIKKYTPEELKKLKHPTMPGYQARFEDALPGCLVYAYFAKKNDDKKGSDKDKKKVAIDDLLNGDPARQAGGPVVTAILILSEPDISKLPKQPKGGKKRK